MKRIGRLIFDAAGGIVALIAGIMGLVGYFNSNFKHWKDIIEAGRKKFPGSGSTWDKILHQDVSHWLAGAAVLVSILALILAVVSVFFIFKKGPHMGLTISIYFFVVVAVCLIISTAIMGGYDFAKISADLIKPK